jgi:hypothetical protein
MQKVCTAGVDDVMPIANDMAFVNELIVIDGPASSSVADKRSGTVRR